MTRSMHFLARLPRRGRSACAVRTCGQRDDDGIAPRAHDIVPRVRDATALTASLVALIVVGTTAGCTSDAPEPPGPTASATVEPPPTPTPTPTVDPADEAAALDGWSRYWAATIRSINGPDPDPALWLDFSTDEVIASNTKLAQSYLDQGLTFTGEPVISDVTVSWAGRDALVVGCVDETHWLGTVGGSPLPPRTEPVHPVALGVNLVGDTWRVTEDVRVPEGVTC